MRILIVCLLFFVIGCEPVDSVSSTPSSSSGGSSYERELVKSRLRNGTGMSNREAETAADAIYKFEAARKR